MVLCSGTAAACRIVLSCLISVLARFTGTGSAVPDVVLRVAISDLMARFDALAFRTTVGRFAFFTAERWTVLRDDDLLVAMMTSL